VILILCIMLNGDMLEDDEPSRIEDEDEECVADEEDNVDVYGFHRNLW